MLTEILLLYIQTFCHEKDAPLFEDQSSKIQYQVKLAFQKVKTYSNRTKGPINISPYRFRYTLGTRAIALGGTDAEVARLLTHRSTSSIANYRAAMPYLQKPIKDALSGEMGIFASAFKGKLIADLKEATRKGHVDALVRDYMHLNGEAIGACGTYARCHQHAPKACLTCRKFEPFVDAPWEKILLELQIDVEDEDDDKIKLISLPFIEAVKEIQLKCDNMKSKVTL